jgi:hypothetical protein
VLRGDELGAGFQFGPKLRRARCISNQSSFVPLSSFFLPLSFHYFRLRLRLSQDFDLSGGGDELLRAASIDLAAVPSTKYERRGGLTDAEKKDRLNRQKKESKHRRIKKLDKPNTETVLSGLADAEKKERLNRQKLESKWRKRTEAMVKNTPSAGSKQSASKQSARANQSAKSHLVASMETPPPAYNAHLDQMLTTIMKKAEDDAGKLATANTKDQQELKELMNKIDEDDAKRWKEIRGENKSASSPIFN